MVKIEIGKDCYYKGIGVKEWQNKIVKVLYDTKERVGINNNIIVYLCEDINGKIKRVIESDLTPILIRE